MKIELRAPFAGNAPADEFDVRQLKAALNRLGYYAPLETVGMNGIPDPALVESLKEFQHHYDLPVSGAVRPQDKTVTLLNEKLSEKPSGQYRWKTVGDNKVRADHAELADTVRDWSQSPDPTEDYNCRCWAEPVEQEPDGCYGLRERFEELQAEVKDLSEKFNDLLIRLQKLVDEINSLVAAGQMSMGSQVIAFLLTLPLKRVDDLFQLLQRYFGMNVSDELLQGADSFLRQYWAARQEARYVRDQRDIVFAQLIRKAKELDETQNRLKDCEEKREK